MARNDFRVKKRQQLKETLSIIRYFSIALIISLLMVTFIRPTIIKGQSMEPTINNNDFLIVSCESLLGNSPEYGDIIVFKSDIVSKEGDCKLLNRVIGVTGDIIEIKNGVVYRNGQSLDEDYVKEEITEGNVERFIVGKNQVFVLGDNRGHSLDSRNEYLSTISYEDIIGTVRFRVYPFNKIGSVY